jgi:hypothetical protein
VEKNKTTDSKQNFRNKVANGKRRSLKCAGVKEKLKKVFHDVETQIGSSCTTLMIKKDYAEEKYGGPIKFRNTYLLQIQSLPHFIDKYKKTTKNFDTIVSIKVDDLKVDLFHPKDSENPQRKIFIPKETKLFHSTDSNILEINFRELLGEHNIDDGFFENLFK